MLYFESRFGIEWSVQQEDMIEKEAQRGSEAGAFTFCRAWKLHRSTDRN